METSQNAGPPKLEKNDESSDHRIFFCWLGLARQMSQWEADIAKFSWMVEEASCQLKG